MVLMRKRRAKNVRTVGRTEDLAIGFSSETKKQKKGTVLERRKMDVLCTHGQEMIAMHANPPGKTNLKREVGVVCSTLMRAACIAWQNKHTQL